MNISTPNVSEARKEQFKSAGKFAGKAALYAVAGWAEASTTDNTDTDDEPRCERCGHELKRAVADDLGDSHIGVCYECKVEMSDKEKHAIKGANKSLHVIPRLGDESTAWVDGE